MSPRATPASAMTAIAASASQAPRSKASRQYSARCRRRARHARRVALRGWYSRVRRTRAARRRCGPSSRVGEAHDGGGDAVERRARHQADARRRSRCYDSAAPAAGRVGHAADRRRRASRALARLRRAIDAELVHDDRRLDAAAARSSSVARASSRDDAADLHHDALAAVARASRWWRARSTIRLPYVLPRRIIAPVVIMLSTSLVAVPAFMRVEPVTTSGPGDAAGSRMSTTSTRLVGRRRAGDEAGARAEVARVRRARARTYGVVPEAAMPTTKSPARTPCASDLRRALSSAVFRAFLRAGERRDGRRR